MTLSPTVAIGGGTGVPASPAGQPVTYTLNAGQVLQIQQQERLIGSPIQATGPIGVWGGSACMHIPLSIAACDSAHQQLMPIKALGNEYVGAQYRGRAGGVDESVYYTMVGAVAGTQLTWDPAPPPAAPATIESGQWTALLTDQHFSVKIQDLDHPFYLATHMSGGDLAGTYGDPEYVNLIPPLQWLPKYLFVTDPTYGNTNLVFVRKKNPSGAFDDVTLDCAGVLTGWLPIGAGGQYELTRIDLCVYGAGQGACNNGVHTASSNTPFGLTVWGWDPYVSYAYPSGASVEPINTVVVPPIPK